MINCAQAHFLTKKQKDLYHLLLSFINLQIFSNEMIPINARHRQTKYIGLNLENKTALLSQKGLYGERFNTITLNKVKFLKISWG